MLISGADCGQLPIHNGAYSFVYQRVKRPKRKLPTQRSLEWLRRRGWRPWVVERWNPYAGIRQDMFGCVDVLAIKGSQTLAVQSTSGAHLQERAAKIAAADALPAILEAGWLVVVHGWVQRANGRWECRELYVTEPASTLSVAA